MFTVGKKQTLQEVLQKYDLPVKVRFASDQQLTVGSSVTIANRFPDLELTEMFDEIYFLANSIIDGNILIIHDLCVICYKYFKLYQHEGDSK